MIGDVGAGEDDTGDETLPPEVDALAVPMPLDSFRAWHRPRKQYVRERQWARYTHKLLTSLSKGQAAPQNLRYLTLPGIDYLDVRTVAEVCRSRGFSLTSTSFLAAQEGNPVRARAQFREEALKQAGHITDDSITVPNRLEEIAALDSQPYRLVRRRGPYDVINIDACGSIALPKAAHAKRLLDAVHKLVEMQIDTRRMPWLLFLTSDARPEDLAPSLKASFKSAIQQNAAHTAEFATGARAFFEMPEGADFGSALDFVAEQTLPFLRFYALGLAKWLLANCSSLDWEVKVLDCFCYTTSHHDDPRPTMASMAFEFMPRPVILRDQFGAVNSTPQHYVPAENYSIRALERVRAMEDLDEKMLSDLSLRSTLMEKTKELLAEAGYLPEVLAGYEAFAVS